MAPEDRVGKNRQPEKLTEATKPPSCNHCFYFSPVPSTAIQVCLVSKHGTRRVSRAIYCNFAMQYQPNSLYTQKATLVRRVRAAQGAEVRGELSLQQHDASQGKFISAPHGPAYDLIPSLSQLAALSKQ